ncbi:hypothetical protein F5B17DRAFT_107114 [Nemania serpens]|nr:hypothetical protein F5B17DRAFT_107114 [Nemania serpens]
MSAKTSSNGNDDDKNNTNTNTTNRSTGANANADATLAAKARVRGRDLLVYGQRQIDRVVSPAARQKVIDATTVFASNRPLLSLFLAAQLLLSLLPLLLFVTFVLSTTVFAVLFAFAFIFFWTGLALVVFVPTLFFTGGLAVLLWLWAMSAFIVFRVLYSRLPASLRGTDKHVIFRKDETPAQSNSKRNLARDIYSDDSTEVIDVETTEVGG